MSKLCSSFASLFCNDSWLSSMSFLQIKTWVLFLFISSFPISRISAMKDSYHEHCNTIVPESISTGEDLDPSRFLQFSNGYYKGGESILGKQDQLNPDAFDSWYVGFHTKILYKTESPRVLKVEGTLTFAGAPINQSHIRRSRNSMWRRSRYVSLELHGFWSEDSGELCMVGSGSGYSEQGKLLDLSAVLNLKYPRKSMFNTSFVTGSVNSLENEGSENHFEPISILAFAQKTYEYTLFSGPETMCSVSNPWPDAGSLNAGKILCEKLRKVYDGFRLKYESNCTAKNCNPFNSIGFLPSFMFIHDVQCSAQGKLRFSLGFKNSSEYGSGRQMVPESTLVGEGMWVEERNELCMVGCHLLNFRDSLEDTTVEDCSIGLSLRFADTLSLRNRNLILGQIWSNKNPKDSDYFERLTFGGGESKRTITNMLGTERLKYNYTETDNAKKSCKASRNAIKNNSGKIYPDGSSWDDMGLDFHVVKPQGNYIWGHLTPVHIGELFPSNQSMLIVSYDIIFPESYSVDSNGTQHRSSDTSNGRPGNIAAEGIYDTENGILCLIGCRYVRSDSMKLNSRTDIMDCEIFIDSQFSPLNPESRNRNYITLTIKSTRDKSDSLYFEPLEVSSIGYYASQAEESIWRMDMEIVMVLISLTFSSIFIYLQLLYVKKHPEVFPSISLLMLVVLTVGHMIPLLLNLEAFFSKKSMGNYHVLPSSGGWVETREVIVRIFTIVAFLLQFRLLQLTWAARLAEGYEKSLWASEKMAVFFSPPFYLVGCLIAWLLNSKNIRHSLWVSLKTSAGLVLDGFLLPQILLNLFTNSHEKALVPCFYVGTTLVRAFPHAYDAYRAGRWQYTPQLDAGYIYANPEWDFYSNAWDVAIPCVGLILAIIIFYQQRFGGRVIVPRRFKVFAEYERAPMVAQP